MSFMNVPFHSVGILLIFHQFSNSKNTEQPRAASQPPPDSPGTSRFIVNLSSMVADECQKRFECQNLVEIVLHKRCLELYFFTSQEY